MTATARDALASLDGELFYPSTATTALGGTIAEDLLFGADNDQVECPSCHDVHNGEPAATVNDHLLPIPYSDGSICLTCHDL